MISTQRLDGMPDRDTLRRLTRSLATLDALLSPEWDGRYYSYNCNWAAGEEMASMRDGEGDQWFAWFGAAGVALAGLSHEKAMFRPGKPWPGIWDTLPAAFAPFRAEAAFDTDNTTFCIWRGAADQVWRCGNIEYSEGDDPDGSAELLALLDGVPESYRAWAAGYYERDVPLDVVAAIYAHEDITPAMLEQLGCDESAALSADLDEIGYPLR
jgi:hypothetical protein